MTDLRQTTIDTYNKSAKELAEYFRGIGLRTKDINLAFKLAGNPRSAKVVEIGCGDGRDAKEIVKRTDQYIGFDVSEELIKLAREHVPTAKFKIADLNSYIFPKELDIVFAFASLLHSDQAEIKNVLKRIYDALKPNGVCYISLKYSDHYEEKIKKDKFGERLFYFYSPDIITKLAGKRFKRIFDDMQTIGNTKWFTLALTK